EARVPPLRAPQLRPHVARGCEALRARRSAPGPVLRALTLNGYPSRRPPPPRGRPGLPPPHGGPPPRRRRAGPRPHARAARASGPCRHRGRGGDGAGRDVPRLARAAARGAGVRCVRLRAGPRAGLLRALRIRAHFASAIALSFATSTSPCHASTRMRAVTVVDAMLVIPQVDSSPPGGHPSMRGSIMVVLALA